MNPAITRIVQCFLVLLVGAGLSHAETEQDQSGNPPKWAMLREQMRNDGIGLRMIKRPDGSISIDLNGRFTHTSALVRDANGKLRPQCFNDFTAMDEALRGKAPAHKQAAPKNEVAEK